MVTGHNAAALLQAEESFTVLKVQLGTCVLLTTTDFHHLILCPVWLCRFCEPSTSNYVFPFVVFDQSNELHPTDKFVECKQYFFLRKMAPSNIYKSQLNKRKTVFSALS